MQYSICNALQGGNILYTVTIQGVPWGPWSFDMFKITTISTSLPNVLVPRGLSEKGDCPSPTWSTSLLRVSHAVWDLDSYQTCSYSISSIYLQSQKPSLLHVCHPVAHECDMYVVTWPYWAWSIGLLHRLLPPCILACSGLSTDSSALQHSPACALLHLRMQWLGVGQSSLWVHHGPCHHLPCMHVVGTGIHTLSMPPV